MFYQDLKIDFVVCQENIKKIKKIKMPWVNNKK